MSETRTEFEARVVRLERTNRVLMLVLTAVVAAGIYLANRHPGRVRAESIQLLDARGAVVAELASRADASGLYLMDGRSKTRLALIHSADSTGLYVYDTDEVTRVGVAQFAHGGGGVALHGPGSRGAAVLYLKGTGSLRFFDDEGRVTNSVVAEAADGDGR